MTRAATHINRWGGHGTTTAAPLCDRLRLIRIMIAHRRYGGIQNPSLATAKTKLGLAGAERKRRNAEAYALCKPRASPARGAAFALAASRSCTGRETVEM